MAQYARPDADISAGSWSASTGSDLYACIDEETASDSDYIRTIRADTTCEIGLSSLSDPSSSSDHVLRVRHAKQGTGSMNTCYARLKQGSTTIATMSCTPGSAQTQELTLSSAEADAITDYTNLRVELQADWASGLTTGWNVSWVELEVPSGGATTYYQSVTGSLTPTGGKARQGNKGVAGSLTAAGTLARQVGKGVAGSIEGSEYAGQAGGQGLGWLDHWQRRGRGDKSKCVAHSCRNYTCATLQRDGRTTAHGNYQHCQLPALQRDDFECGLMSNYPVGNTIRVTAAFTNSAGTAIDPTAVYCTVLSPAGVTTTYQYGVDGALIKDSTGNYHLDIDASSAGEWRYRWYSTGTGKAAEESVFWVDDSDLV